MDYRVEKHKNFQLIGFIKTIKSGEGYEKCPAFWDEIGDKYFSKVNDDSELSKAIVDYKIGEYALCMENENHKEFRYMICGLYTGGNIPKEMEVITLPDALWAKFKCIGPMPGAMQSVNTQIWKEWIPNNPEYEINQPFEIEWYSNADITQLNYESEIWFPVKKK